jgi:putative FmdB family regulatory protein
MPLFEYVCNACRAPFEILHKGAERRELIACPACGAKDATKKFSSFAASVKGASAALPSCASGDCSGGSCGLPYASPCSGGACGLQ